MLTSFLHVRFTPRWNEPLKPSRGGVVLTPTPQFPLISMPPLGPCSVDRNFVDLGLRHAGYGFRYECFLYGYNGERNVGSGWKCLGCTWMAL